jgi:putative colanic acid biosynthesis UDP-glucose lipid carrier transferase
MPDDISNYVQASNIVEVWLAVSSWEKEAADKLVNKLNCNVITLRYFPELINIDFLEHSITEILGFPAINIIASPMIGTNRLIKALEDRVLSLMILILISPLMLIIAVFIKLSSPGPIFYRQLRHGWDGKPIYIYKFRTMYMHDEAAGTVTQASIGDPRITKIGKVLRCTSLDELPQFINVLQGRMSIVGPRPHAVEHNEYYKSFINSYMLRHHVKPGITGWAQVNGWRGETDTLEKMQKRVEHDLYYINHWALLFDLKIILLTIFKGFVNRNAY